MSMTADNDVDAWFTDAMNSGDPVRVADALRKLRELLPPRKPIHPPSPDVLDTFPTGAPVSVVMNYIWVLGDYQLFTSPLEPAEIVRWWTEAVLRHPEGAAALQITLYLSENQPRGMDVGDIISYLAERGVQPGRSAQGAEYLALNFLDHSETYTRAVEALTSWVGKPVLRDVLHDVAPYVRPEDRAGLGL